MERKEFSFLFGSLQQVEQGGPDFQQRLPAALGDPEAFPDQVQNPSRVLGPAPGLLPAAPAWKSSGPQPRVGTWIDW